ncbi:MAG: DUF222 domain-containing protein [Mycobacteriales bacterium]
MSAVRELSDADAALRFDPSVDVDAKPIVAVGELIVRIEQASRALEALRSRAIGRFDAAGGASADGSPSTAAWLRGRCQLHPTEAHARVHTARVLRDLPATAEALAAGRIPFASAVLIASLAKDAPIEVMRACEPEMLFAAEAVNPAQLRGVIGRLRYSYAKEAVTRDEARRYALRQLHLASRFDELHSVNGWLMPETAAGLQILLEARMTPPAPDDPRTRPQRLHDALAAWVAETLATGELPDQAGERPHVTVVVDRRTLLDTPGAPPAHLERHGPISGEAARRLCCDAKVARVITDGPSEILDAGRYTRTATPAIRRALRVRDGEHCVVPGCTVPIRWCEVHHLIHWIDGGETNLGDLGYVCLPHHHDVHEGRMTLHRQPDGTWQLRKRE